MTSSPSGDTRVDVPQDRLDRWFFNHGILGLAIGIGILCVTFGWATGLLAAAVHAVSYVMLSGAINAVGHTRGRRPYDNPAGNSQWLALFTAGEGLHNNHHAAPTSARFALARGQIDPGWWVTSALDPMPAGHRPARRGEAQASRLTSRRSGVTTRSARPRAARGAPRRDRRGTRAREW